MFHWSGVSWLFLGAILLLDGQVHDTPEGEPETLEMFGTSETLETVETFEMSDTHETSETVEMSDRLETLASTPEKEPEIRSINDNYLHLNLQSVRFHQFEVDTMAVHYGW